VAEMLLRMITIIILSSIPYGAYSQEIPREKATKLFDEKKEQKLKEIYKKVQKELADKKEYNCKIERNEVRKLLSEPSECFIDADCNYFDYGYPWQKEPCFKAITSTYREENNYEKIIRVDEHRKRCIYNSR
jgi:hypothetical protein